jgi:hypothetical protein
LKIQKLIKKINCSLKLLPQLLPKSRIQEQNNQVINDHHRKITTGKQGNHA